MRGILPRYSICPCSSSLGKEQKYPMGAARNPPASRVGCPAPGPSCQDVSWSHPSAQTAHVEALRRGGTELL